MKRNWKIIIVGIILLVSIIGLSVCFLIMPGLNKMAEANKYRDLTVEEKTKMISSINTKYEEKIKKVNEEYDKEVDKIKEKYNEKINNIKSEYSKKIDEVNNKKNEKQLEQDREFRSNGFNEKYYSLKNEISELQQKVWDLELEKSDKIREMEGKQSKEISPKFESKTEKISLLENSKDDEIYKVENRSTTRFKIRINGLFKIMLGSIIALIPILYVIITFNKLTKLSNYVKEKWSSVDVLLKQRTDMIPNIVEVIKGYVKHENKTLVEVTKARNLVVKASNKLEEINTNKNLTNNVDKLLLIHEDYPELKANKNFLKLQDELVDLEKKISSSRQDYNSAVLLYKNKQNTFPSNIVSNLFNFKSELFFTSSEEDKENPDINFNK